MISRSPSASVVRPISATSDDVSILAGTPPASSFAHGARWSWPRAAPALRSRPNAGSIPPRRSSRRRARAPWRASSRRPGPATTRSVLAEIEPDTFAPSRSAMALASSRVIRSSDPVKTIVLPASGWPAAIASIGSTVTSRSERVERRLVARLGEEVGDRLGDDRPDPLDVGQFLRRARLRARRRERSPSRRSGGRGGGRWSRRRDGCRGRTGTGSARSSAARRSRRTDFSPKSRRTPPTPARAGCPARRGRAA